jgi:hypothetical protein
MALLSEDYLARAICNGRCVRHDIPLEPQEYLVSRRAAAFLYDGSLAIKDDSAIAFCEALFKALPPLLKQASSSNVVRRAVLGFCSALIRQPSIAREEFIHWALFEFWDELWRSPEERIPLSEKYYEGGDAKAAATTKFSREILPRLRAADDAYPDIVGLGGRGSRELVLAEVKLEGIDDRAVGQILRYYQLGRAICDGGGHNCDIRGVLPVLIVRDIRRLAFWEAFPLHFREFLHVLTYGFDANGFLELVDSRRALAAQARQRTVYRG